MKNIHQKKISQIYEKNILHEEKTQAYSKAGPSNDNTCTIEELIDNEPSAPNKPLDKDALLSEDIIETPKESTQELEQQEVPLKIEVEK